MTKAFANTLRLQNNTTERFPRTETNIPSNCSHRKNAVLQSSVFTATDQFILIAIPSQQRKWPQALQTIYKYKGTL